MTFLTADANAVTVRSKPIPAPGAGQDQMTWKYDHGTGAMVWVALPGGGGGAVSTDTIWDAKGDLAVGTGTDTALRLAVGSDGQILVADSTATTGLKYRTLRPAGWSPADNGWALGASVNPETAGQAANPTAGFLVAARIPIIKDGTITDVEVNVTVAGSGLANCFIGIFNSSNVLIGKTSDQSTPWGSTGLKAATVTAEAGQSLAVVAGQFVVAAILVGTGTLVQFNRNSNLNSVLANAHQTLPLTRAMASQTGGLSAMPAALPTMTASGFLYFFGLV